MMDVACIGDLHGNMDDWLRLRKGHRMTIQLGDLGCGFAELPPPVDGHYFIRGNHDSPDIARSRPDYLGDFGMMGAMFYASGAASIDRDQRTPGFDWWADEELGESDMDAATRLYAERRPNIVVTHCAPREAELRIGAAWRGSRTSHWLQRLLEIHRPSVWVFGHYHEAHDFVVNGTRFICVAKNTVMA